MIEGSASAESRRHRSCGGGRRTEYAESIENTRRRQHLARTAPLPPHCLRPRSTEPARETIRLSISTNVPDSGRSDQRVSAVTWNKNDEALAAALGGNQRRAVGERHPGALVQRGVGFGQHLSAHGHVGRHRHSEERTFARECVERLRLLPGQAAAENAPATPELHRHEIVIGGGESRSGKAHQHAAIFDPARELIARLGDIADVGEDQHWQALLDELARPPAPASRVLRAARRQTVRARARDSRSRPGAAVRCRRSSR